MKRFLLLIFATVTLFACSKDSLEYPEDSVEPRSGITLQLSLSESSTVQTKAQSTAEATLNNLWLFVFNSSGTLAQKFKARIIRNNVYTADFTIKEGAGLGLYACANVSAAEEAKFDGLVKGSAMVADLKAITIVRSLLSAPGLPMWGELLNQTITASTTQLNMTLTRSCSRVDVTANSIADFGLYGIEKLLKTATVGLIFQGSSLVAAGNTIDVVPTNKALYSIYLYENAILAADEATAESKATAVIVRATYKGFEGYYKLRVKYGTPVKYDIGRNVIYSLNITNVKAPGFATLAEAEANSPQNVDYTITVSDGDATDLVTSNGQYYLGVSNSDYVAYNSDAMGNEVVVTVTHNAPSSITAGTVTASGTGLTLRTNTISTSTQKQKIRVDMTNYFTSGTLTLRLGNLMKVVTIKKMPTLNMNGGLISDYSATSCVQGDWDQDPTWSWFATNSIMIGLGTRRVQNPSGGIWMRFDRNIGLANTPRSTGAYVTSTDSKGRSRIVVTQESGALQYVSGVPARISSISASFTVNVMTDLPGWTIRARSNSEILPITLGAKTGSPVRGTPTNCSISVSVPSNLGAERAIVLFLCASEDPSMELSFTSVVQDKVQVNIAATPSSQSNIPYTGGTYRATITSTHAWNISSAMYCTVTPNAGQAGTTSVSISVPLNPDQLRDIRVIFNTTYGEYTSQAVWTGNQLMNPYPIGSYIPSNVLAAAGWPSNKLPPIGLQVAMRGYQQLPGIGSPSQDALYNWKTAQTTTVGVERVADFANAKFVMGKLNTDAMIAGIASLHPAAQYCRQMGPEWYLPSLAELHLISEQHALLSSSYTFSAQIYWSSTEDRVVSSWVVAFPGSALQIITKNSNNYVRCVRDI